MGKIIRERERIVEEEGTKHLCHTLKEQPQSANPLYISSCTSRVHLQLWGKCRYTCSWNDVTVNALQLQYWHLYVPSRDYDVSYITELIA